MESDPLSAKARKARDEILDLLTSRQYVMAIRRYMAASGKPLAEARTVIDRLIQVLDKPDLESSDKEFLAGFRASLDHVKPAPASILPHEPAAPDHERVVEGHTARGPAPATRSHTATEAPRADSIRAGQSGSGPTIRRQRETEPALVGPPGVLPVLLHVMLAQFALSIGLIVFSAAFGGLGYLVNNILAMVSAMVAGVAILMLGPPLFDELLRRLGLRRYTRTPSLLFDFALSMCLLVGGLVGSFTIERWLWHQRAEVVTLADASYLLDERNRAGSNVFRVEALPILVRPAATHDDHVSRNADRGGSYVNHWHVNLIATRHRNDIGCLWFGWRTRSGSGSGIDDPMRLDEPGDYYVIADYDRHYLRAVRKALKLEDAPGCTTIINRVPHPENTAAQLAQRMRLLLTLSVVLPWLFALLIGLVRLRPAQPANR